MNLIAVIMAGGAGTRFWPLSTDAYPKQFLALTGERTLIQMSYDRVVDLVGPERVLVLTNERYVDLVAEQLPEIPAANIVGEPCRRDTAAAVALAAALCRHRFGEDSTMAVLTADHVITPVERFQQALKEAAAACQEGGLYTIGIEPTYPATGYGYLEMAESLQAGQFEHFRLHQFKEKPDLETARGFLASGKFYWNSGMFVWRTRTIVQQFERHLPAHLEALSPAVEQMDGPSGAERLRLAFEGLQRISVDFAILEKAEDVRAVVPGIAWDDVGGWQAIGSYLKQGEDGNQSRGCVITREARRNVVFSDSPDLPIVLLGVEDLVVVHSAEGVLVAHKDHLENLKSVVKDLG